MSLVGKLESEIEVHAPAHRFYRFFKHEISHVVNVCPKLIQKIKVHNGDWKDHCHGSIKVWNYVVEDKAEVLKERVEFDDKNLVVCMIGLEGDVFEHYKVFKATFQFVPKGPNRSAVILILEYEKLHDGPPYPHKYHDAMHKFAKDIESHLK
ncbi:MLP-like protein 34 [Cucurbita maxima]|uniref:MLP-like protein 34 n=1 Tax=Cucurbita maxima TaxID=3661 RepID=A0A6J1JFT8_CUCMA|nr:MLP-like protein 34 [Cucurbita maxima]